MSSPDEMARGIVMPVQVYPMFETAVRAAAGADVDDHLVAVSELWSPLLGRGRRQPLRVDAGRPGRPRRSARPARPTG